MPDELEEFAQGSILPQRISENGEKDEPLLEVIICDGISGGADYINNMPRHLTLTRKLADGTEYSAEYRIDLAA